MRAVTRFIFIVFLTLISSSFAYSSGGEGGADISRVNPGGTVDTRIFGYTSAIETSGDGRYIFVSGVFSIDESGKIIGTTFKEQIEKTFSNVRVILSHFNAKPENIVKTTSLIVNHKEEYLSILHDQTKKLFGNEPPTSTVIPVPRLALDSMLFEIELVIYIPKEK